MSLSFLSEEIKSAISHLNYNRISEIRLRKGQPVIVCYDGNYRFLGRFGLADEKCKALAVEDVSATLNAATGGCVYAFTEQLKNGFITVEHGVRIGIAGEYVTEKGVVNTIKNVTSLNIRVPHDIKGCAEHICSSLYRDGIKSTLIYSKPGMGKTTDLRDIARYLSKDPTCNALVFDERGEIAALDAYGDGYDIGTVDVVRCFSKMGAISSAIRAMKPDVIITDELYGEEDFKAVRYASDCSIAVIASSHICDRSVLKNTPFEYFVELKSLGGEPVIYDKNFNPVCDCCVDDGAGGISCRK